MSSAPKRAGLLAILFAFAALAYTPILTPGFAADDLEVLLGASDVACARPFDLRDLYTVAGAEGRPAAGLSLVLSVWTWSGWFWTGEASWTPTAGVFLRLENLLLLILAAWGLFVAVRRGLAPWTGPEHSRAASRSACLFLVVHPLCVSSVQRISARPELCALAIGGAAIAAFLRGRQEQQYSFTASAGLLAILAGLCSPWALFLPPTLALLEYCSARRHRSQLTRLRTALTTLLVFGVCVSLERIGRALFAENLVLESRTHAHGVLELVGFGFEKLGVLMLPVNSSVTGGAGYILASAALLLALHPAFVAARAAPRLWGRIAIGWLGAVFLTQLPTLGVRHSAATLAAEPGLVLGATIAALGFAIAVTALQGLRRVVLPVAIALAWAGLTRANATPWRQACAQQMALQGTLLDEAARSARGTPFLVLEPPPAVHGVAVVEGPLADLLDDRFLSLDERLPDEDRLEGLVAPRVQGLSLDAFRAFVREPDFDELRSSGIVVLADPERTGLNLSERAHARVREPSTDAPGWLGFPLGSPRPSEGATTWRGEGSSPRGQVLEALAARAMVVTATPGASTNQRPQVEWSPRSELLTEGRAEGVWTQGQGGVVARFDLEQSLQWLLGGRVRHAWFSGELSSVDSVQVVPDVPPLPPDVLPDARRDDWFFDLGEVSVPEPVDGQHSWRLGILDLTTLEYREWPAIGDLVSGLKVTGVEAWVRSARSTHGALVGWTLDYRIDDVAVARARGRLGG